MRPQKIDTVHYFCTKEYEDLMRHSGSLEHGHAVTTCHKKTTTKTNKQTSKNKKIPFSICGDLADHNCAMVSQSSALASNISAFSHCGALMNH